MYWLTKNQLFADRWSLIELFKTDYPDPAIEHKLAELLLSSYQKNDDGLRTSIIRALRDHGTHFSLRALEDILSQQRGVAQVKKLIAGGVSINPDNPELEADWLKGKLALLEADVEAEFVELLRTAISAIKQRDSAGFAPHAAPPAEIEFEPDPQSEDEVIAVVLAAKAKAEYHLHGNPAASILHGRKALERVGKTLCREHGLQRKNRSLDSLQMAELLELLTEKDPVTHRERNILPPLIEAVARACHIVMAKSLHDHNDAEARATSRRMAEAALLNLEDLVQWFIARHGPSGAD